MPAALLVHGLESELPTRLSVGGGTALFICGWCFAPAQRIRRLWFGVDSELQAVEAQGMPRLEVLRALHPRLDPWGAEADPGSEEDLRLLSYRSGFWGIVRIAGPRPAGEIGLTLQAELEDGGSATAELGRIEVVELSEALGIGGSASTEGVAARWPAPQAGSPVAISMATYNAPEDLLVTQLESIRAQSHTNWLCFVSDDGSSEERYRKLVEGIGEDQRFVLSRSPRRRGFYRNFERALAMVPLSAEYVVLADQDDRWHPDKLAALVAAIGDAQLVYSDARVTSRDGKLISETWWATRKNNHSDMLSLLVANSVTGAASLLRREVLDDALPFPPAQFAHFHDHWLGLVALARGEIAYVDRPLYDYVQHSSASLGHAGANQMPSLSERLRRSRNLHERVRMWRLHYFVDVCRISQFASVLELRCRSRMSRRKQRVLRAFLRADRSPPALATLALRGARELIWPVTPETLGAEWMLFCAFAWRRLLVLSARDRPQRRLRLDGMPPPTLIQPPGRRTGLHASAGTIAAKIASLPWSASDSAPRRVNLLVPTIDLTHFFGGYIGKLNLAHRLAQRGERVRIVTVDPVGPLPGTWRADVEAYSGLAGLFDHVEVVFGRESSAIEVSREDAFIATTWWTAHIAQAALGSVRAERFVYLIQEYEPFTFPMGTFAALAQQSYAFPHYALFSTELLRDYFRLHRIGVYADGSPTGDQRSASFQNAITDVEPPGEAELRTRRPRKLLFYARPESHAARNMFELGLLGLARAMADGTFADGWELHGIGTVELGRTIPLGGGGRIELIPRAPQSSYAELLREHDVGLALMYTPHPSLVPIEMASAGMLTVTNSFENKTPGAMAAISDNLVCVEASIEGIAAGLIEAARGASDVKRRLRGSQVGWSRSWRQSFDDDLLDRLVSVLHPRRIAA